mmetsp:Transcript_9372/g.31154  ORF Transcript_9372/g.31154 Transcript_9372/m.31154 type:complete len:201 (+) Transcript_9372:62-664(+)
MMPPDAARGEGQLLQRDRVGRRRKQHRVNYDLQLFRGEGRIGEAKAGRGGLGGGAEEEDARLCERLLAPHALQPAERERKRRRERRRRGLGAWVESDEAPHAPGEGGAQPVRRRDLRGELAPLRPQQPRCGWMRTHHEQAVAGRERPVGAAEHHQLLEEVRQLIGGPRSPLHGAAVDYHREDAGRGAGADRSSLLRLHTP